MSHETDKLLLGCCGAFCKTCKEYLKLCKGCKMGYHERTRDIDQAKFKIKLCCFREHGLHTCADCIEYSACNLMKETKLYLHPHYKKVMEYILNHGYLEFFKKANDWKNAQGSLRDKKTK